MPSEVRHLWYRHPYLCRTSSTGSQAHKIEQDVDMMKAEATWGLYVGFIKLALTIRILRQCPHQHKLARTERR